MKIKLSISDILSKINKENLKKRFKEAAQMINLIYRNYSDGETQMLSTSLTYFSMLAIFPVIALILGISKIGEDINEKIIFSSNIYSCIV